MLAPSSTFVHAIALFRSLSIFLLSVWMSIGSRSASFMRLPA